MDMRVAGSLVMDSTVGAHSFVYKVVLHIGAHKGSLPYLRPRLYFHPDLQKKFQLHLVRLLYDWIQISHIVVVK